jgi:ferredoxin-NADP reductase
MADTKKARLLSRIVTTDESALLRFAAEEDLAFTGGQYIIVNTGIALGEGKTAKRAYSVLSSDADQRTFEIAVRRVGTGPGSNFMLELQESATLLFTGPWGKFLPRSEEVGSEGIPSSTLVVATDTGITAALGLLCGQAFQPLLPQTHLYWLVQSDSYFVSEQFVRQRMPDRCGHFERIQVPSATAARSEWLAREQDTFLGAALRVKPKAAYFSGDGFLLAAFRDALHESPEHSPAIFVESFFNHQELKAVSKGASQ